MPAARLIVCERSGKWAVALRRFLSPDGPRVFETRNLDDCRDEVVAWPASLVAVEVTSTNLAGVAGWLHDYSPNFRHARTVVLGTRGMESSEWLLRELGAVHVVFSPRDAALLARVVRRHVAAYDPGEPTLRQLIWQRIRRTTHGEQPHLGG